ncbi:hypothetical protein D3C73_889170 [compost metagenome]
MLLEHKIRLAVDAADRDLPLTHPLEYSPRSQQCQHAFASHHRSKNRMHFLPAPVTDKHRLFSQQRQHAANIISGKSGGEPAQQLFS